ncbi:MAG: hypothetical protein OCC49_18940 [Fibrobacterales bacterium]
MFKILILVVYVFLLCSCSWLMDGDSSSPIESNWIKDKNIDGYSNAQLNSSTRNDTLFVATINDYYIMSIDSLSDGFEVITRYTTHDYFDMGQKPTISKDYLIRFNDQSYSLLDSNDGLYNHIPQLYIEVSKTEDLSRPSSMKYPRVDSLDFGVNIQESEFYPQEQCLISGDRGVFFYRYLDTIDEKEVNNNVAFFSITPDKNRNWLPNISIDSTMSLGQRHLNITSLNTIDGYFYFSSREVFVIISPNNIVTIQEINSNDDIIFDVIKDPFGSKLFRIHENKIMESTDMGYSWIEKYSVSHFYSTMHYVQIDSKIIGYSMNQIFEIVMGDDGVIVNEINNEGIGQTQITSISNVNDEMIYLTTTSGGYYRKMEDFFEYKE